MQLNQIALSIENLMSPKINVKCYHEFGEKLLIELDYLVKKIIQSVSKDEETNLKNSSMKLLVNLQGNTIASISYSMTLVPKRNNKQTILISSYIQNDETNIRDLIDYHDKIKYLDTGIKELEDDLNEFIISKPLFVQLLNILLIFSKSFPDEKINFNAFRLKVISDKVYDFIIENKVNPDLQYVLDLADIECLNYSLLKTNDQALFLINNSTVVDIYKKELNLTFQIGKENEIHIKTLSMPIQKFLNSVQYTGKDFIYKGCD